MMIAGTRLNKLYTVLSAYGPNQTAEHLPKYSNGQCPDWNALIRAVAARNPDKSDSWAKRAVRQYNILYWSHGRPQVGQAQIFPIGCNKWDFAHTHLSFVERNQHDMVCLTKGGNGGGNCCGGTLARAVQQSAKNYETAHAQHSKRMLSKLNCLPVDQEFWPTPTEYD